MALNNETIYAIAFVVLAGTIIYKVFFYTRKTTDYDDYKLMQAYVQAEQRGLIGRVSQRRKSGRT